MIHQLIALILTVLMHIICFTVISERKYSVKKNGSYLFRVYYFHGYLGGPGLKKVFLLLNYASVFCIFFCFSIMVSSIWFKDELSAAAMYTKTIIRILLYQPAMRAYIRFLRPTMREVPGSNKRIWHPISLVSMLFLIVFYICVCLLCGKRFQSVVQYSVCLHRSYLLLGIVGHFRHNKLYEKGKQDFVAILSNLLSNAVNVCVECNSPGDIRIYGIL